MAALFGEGDGSFESRGTAHAVRPLEFSPRPRKKHPKARPTYISKIPRGTDYAAGLQGADILGLPMLPQGAEITGVLEAKAKNGRPLYPLSVILVPRRSTKTTSINNVLTGRCARIPGYRAVITAQDGTRARDAFTEYAWALDANKEWRGQFKIMWSNGHEGVRWNNGSLLLVVPPEPGAFRGKPADLLWFDEAGELPLKKAEGLVAGALPLMDTRPQGQVIISGTPGMERAGLLWDTLQVARQGKPRVGIVDYSILDTEESAIYPPEGDSSPPALNWEVVERVHPGLNTLTTREVIQDRFERLPLLQFEREYLCRFPFDSTVAVVDPTKWADAASKEGMGRRPHDVAVAFDCAPDSSSAAVVAAWRDEKGRIHGEVLACRSGTNWVAGFCAPIARELRREIAHDVIGANQDVATALNRARARTKAYGTKDMMGGASRLVQDIANGNAVHYDQPDLSAAALGAQWRTVGETGRMIGRKASTHDVCTFVAWSIAMWQYDSRPTRRNTGFITPADLKD